MKLVFSTFTREIIFLIFKEIVFLEKMILKFFDQLKMEKLKTLHTEHTLYVSLNISRSNYY